MQLFRRRILLVWWLLFITFFMHMFAQGSYAQTPYTVSATVPPGINDYQITLTKSPGDQEVVSQHREYTYELTYGSSVLYDSDVRLVFEWDLGTIDGNPTARVPIVSYMIGTATNGYNDVEPVIDTINRRITWNFVNFPAMTSNQVVRFTMQTNANYTGNEEVRFLSRAHLTALVTDVSYYSRDLVGKYKFSGGPPDLSTPTPVPQNPTAQPPRPSVFRTVTVAELGATQAMIELLTNNRVREAYINYGTEANKLQNTVRVQAEDSRFLFNLAGLTANQNYYYRVYVRELDGTIRMSNLFTFKTAESTSGVPIVNNGLIVTSNNVILTEPNANEPVVSLVIPYSTVYEFKLSSENVHRFKEISAVVRPKVLAADSNNANSLNINTLYASLKVLGSDTLTGVLRTPEQTGLYEIVVRSVDFDGRVAEKKIADLKVVAPLTVRSKDGKPIEKAEIVMYHFNPLQRLFEMIAPQNMNILNPNYTNNQGILDITLPPSEYKVVVRAPGYQDQEVVFKLGMQENESYPQISLSPTQFQLMTSVEYYRDVAGELSNQFKYFIAGLAVSERVYSLFVVLGIVTMIVLTPLSLAMRLRVSLLSLPFFFGHYFRTFLLRQKMHYSLHGQVVRHPDGAPLAKAIVTVYANKRKVAETRSNVFGEFFITVPLPLSVRLEIHKKGYSVVTRELSLPEESRPIIELVHVHSLRLTLYQTVLRVLEHSLGFLYEAFLLLSLIFLGYFWIYFGALRVWPLLLVFLVNGLLCYFYLHTYYEHSKKG